LSLPGIRDTAVDTNGTISLEFSVLAKVSTAALLGIDAFRVELEVDLSKSGMPAFTMVGLAEGAVRESKERVFTALKNSGFRIPPSRITVNLAPADMRKEGSGYDLPLAAALLVASGVLPQQALDGWMLAGELSLDGQLKAVPGMLPLALKAREDGAKGLIAPPGNAAEAAVVEEVPVYAPETLADVLRLLTGELVLEPVAPGVKALWENRSGFHVDFSEVKTWEN